MTILDVKGKKIESKKPVFSRAERRRFKHSPLSRQLTVAGTEGVPEYYRLLAYGQILVYQMSEVQMRMAGVPVARGRRPLNARDTFSIQLTEEWNELIEKMEEVQTMMKDIETEQAKREEAEKKNILDVPNAAQ